MSAEEGSITINEQPFVAVPQEQQQQEQQQEQEEIQQPQQSQQQVPQGIDESGIEIGSAPKTDSSEEEEAEEEGIYLGDVYRFTTSAYGIVKGTIYYLDSDRLIRVLSDTQVNKLYDFAIIDGDFDPRLGVEKVELLRKGIRTIKRKPNNSTNSEEVPGFLINQRFLINQQLVAYAADGSEAQTYTIVSLNEKDDRISLKDSTGVTTDIDFDFTGIPSDLPFVILAIDATTIESIGDEEGQGQGQEQQEEDEEDYEEELEIDDAYELEEETEEDYAKLVRLNTSERIYSELFQKAEMLTDLLSSEEKIKQTNPAVIRSLRSFVEMCSSLKNSIIQRNADGIPSGERTISLNTLLDILSNRTVPIVRPVLQTIRMLVAESSNILSDVDQIEFQNLSELINQTNAHIESQGGLIAAAEQGVGLPAWYRTMYSLFKLFPMGDKYSGTGYTVSEDADFFRGAAPGGAAPGLDEPLQGLTVLTKSEERNEQYAEHPDQFIQPIQSSLRRAHGPILRALEKGGTEVAIPADKAQVLGYVVFPYKAVLSGAMGHIRPGTLWESMRRGMAEKTWMSKLLDQLGGVQTTKDTNSVFYVAQDDASAVSVQFSDYLELLLKGLIPTGPGDLAALKQDLGITDLELTLEQQAAVQSRVEEVRKSLRSMITQMRTKEPPAAPTIHGFFQDGSLIGHLETIGKKHPYIGELLNQMGTRTPGYKQVDIAAMAYLMVYAKDYVATAYGGANPKGAEKARIRLALESSLQKLQEILHLETLRRTQGYPPEPNPCEHTEALAMIRKVRDEKDRMVLLIKFLSKYKGLRDENWVTCSVCNKHLVCQHEILQIQQFLNPRDKNALQKEIVLNYAGGLFGSNYICRNCGLPIQELGYDTSIEYDDQGRPMMGRDVLVDKDFLEEMEMKLLLSGAYEEEGVQPGTKDPIAEKPEITGILRVLTDTLGISLDKKSLRTLIGRIDADFAQIMKEANYIAEKKKRMEEKKERLPDYADYLARKKIAISAAHLLLEIQTHTPDYVVDFFIEGCASPGFGGYPLVRGSSAESPEQTTGIQYMSCAVAGIVREDAPWVDGFQKLSNTDQKRRKTVQNMITLQLKQTYQANTTIQQEMEKKRIYIEQLYGAAAVQGRPSERLPRDFLPRMEYAADANANAAESPMIAEGAKGSFGELLKADTWVRALNRLAKNGTRIVQGSPYSEASCCVSPIGNPGQSIKEAQLPSMPELFVLKPGFVRQTTMYTPMIPRELQPFNATPSLDVAYRVFLQLCWKGPRVGLAHELGYDHKCDWCDTEISTEYLYPDVNYAGTPIIDEQALRSTFDTQGIPLTKESFQLLLDQAHKRTAFPDYRVPTLPPATQVVEQVAALPAPPVTDWSAHLKETQAALGKLPAAASEAEIALALGPLRDSLGSAEDAILSKLGEEKTQLLISILHQAPQTIFEVARSYFLVPSRRLLATQFQASSRLKVENKYFKLSREHVTLLHTVLEDHTDYLKQPLTDKDGVLKQVMKKAQLKLQYFVEQMSECIKISSELRLSRVRYDETMDMNATERFLKEVIRAMLVGPIGSLLDPTFVPLGDGETITDASGTSDRFLASFINSMLNKYKVERLSYDPVGIRQKLEESKEREKQRFIGELDRMKPEEKALELVKKRIGIGRWAIGGTKLVYAYDPDQWEKNRQENLNNYSGSAAVQGQAPILLQDGLEQPDLQTADGGYDNFDNHGDGDGE